MAAERVGGPSARSGDAGSTDSIIDRLKQQESVMESLKNPVLKHQRSRSASDLLESTSKSQLDSAASTGSSCSSVFSATQLDEERKDKLHPIPPRRTKKLKGRSRSSSAISSLEQAGSLLTTVFKRPLAGQRSNPELTSKVKPPRPPPPKRQIPPRSYVHPTSKSNQAKGTTALGGDKHPSVVVDTRAQRRPRNNRSPQPERPPLPYETCIPQKKPINHTSTDSSRQDHTDDHSINGSVAAMRHRLQREEDEIRVLVTPPPAEYEVVVPSNVRKSSGNIPTLSEGSSTSFHDHPFPGPIVRGKVPKVVTGGGDNKVDNLANRRNTEHRESVAVPYELPTRTKTKGEEITTEEASVKDSATASNSETGHAKQQTDQGNDGHTFQDSGQYTYARDSSIGWWAKEDDSTEVVDDVGSEPIYIEMDPAVYIPPPKDYKPKKRSKDRSKNQKMT